VVKGADVIEEEAEKIYPKLSTFPKLLEKLKNINLKQVSQD